VQCQHGRRSAIQGLKCAMNCMAIMLAQRWIMG
jgi:hypothetical protein